MTFAPLTRRWFASALLGLSALAGIATAHAGTTLTMSSWVPPTHFLVQDILTPWMNDVAKATEGRVTIKMLPKAVGSPPQHWELARKGVADITWGNFTYEPERFKMMWFAELPQMGAQCEATSVALWRTYEKYLAGNAAFQGVHLLGMGMLGGGQINHGSKDVVTPEDLKNQKVRMGGPIQKRLLADMGAIPVSAPATKAYELLEGGVIDASLHGLESVVNFRLDGKLTHHTIIPEGFYDATFFVAMNGAKWASLSSADQQAITQVSGEHLARHWGRVFDQQSAAAEAKMRAAGHAFSQPSAALLASVQSVRAAMLQEWTAEAPTWGVRDGAAMVAYYEQQYRALRR